MQFVKKLTKKFEYVLMAEINKYGEIKMECLIR
jgi:hypothetical protein